MKNTLKKMSLRSIIMILCSSFVILIIAVSTVFYITGLRHINSLVKQNAANLVNQAAENLDRKFEQVKKSTENNISGSYYFLKMHQNILENKDPISVKYYSELAAKIQNFVKQNSQDVSTVILMLSNNSIVLNISNEDETYRCKQPDYASLYNEFSNTDLCWIYNDAASNFIGNPQAIPHLGMIQMLGSSQSSVHGFLYIGLSDKGIARELSSYHITNNNILVLTKQEELFFSDTPSMFQNEENYILTSPMHSVPLTIAAVIPETEMFVDLETFQTLVFSESVTAIIFCCILFVIITKLISAPAEQLAKQLNSVETLKQLTSVHATGGKDFEQITTAINHMYRKIQNLILSLKEENQCRKDAELKILYAQINPHFLYNTLDSIGQLCEMQETEAAYQMVRELADFYRIGVSKGENFIQLREETIHVKSYLSILQTRFEDFEFFINIPDELLNLYVPKIILQPLAENAIYHGIHTTGSGGIVTITGKLDHNILLLEVCDDGNGIEEEILEKIQALLKNDSATTSSDVKVYGLKNVHQRIVLQFGENYGISISSVPEQGTSVLIKLPYLTDLREDIHDDKNIVC